MKSKPYPIKIADDSGYVHWTRIEINEQFAELEKKYYDIYFTTEEDYSECYYESDHPSIRIVWYGILRSCPEE